MKQQTDLPVAEQKNSTRSETWAYSSEPILFDIGSLCEELSKVQDGRKARGRRYSLMTMLILMLVAKLSGEDTPDGMADWAKQREAELVRMLGLKHTQTPHASTYGRVLRKHINPAQFEAVIHDYFARQPDVKVARQICVDGKQIRGTALQPGEGNVYLLGAFIPDVGVMLMQVELASGDGELTVAPKLLHVLDLQGKIVTGDAAFTQRNLSVQIVAAGGDYVWKVKDNQPTLHADIDQLFASATEPALPGFSPPKTDFRSATETRCRHGRIDTRTLTVSSLLAASSDWPHLAQVFKIVRQTTCKKTGEQAVFITYGVTSLSLTQASPSFLLHTVRHHWGIEGASHQRRDCTLHEDFCQLRRGHAAHIMAILNNITLALIDRADFRTAPHARRAFCAHPARAIDLLISAH